MVPMQAQTRKEATYELSLCGQMRTPHQVTRTESSGRRIRAMPSHDRLTIRKSVSNRNGNLVKPVMGQWSAAFMPLHRSAADDAWSDFAPSTLRELKRHKCRAPSITSKTSFH